MDPKSSGDPAREPQRLATPEERDRALKRLGDAFARDVLTVDEYESRLTQLFAAKTSTELVRLTSDLPRTASVPVETASALPARAQPTGVASPAGPAIQSIFGNVVRAVTTVPQHQVIQAVFGNIELDASTAELPDRVILEIISACGNVVITLPWNAEIINEGSAILGVFEAHERTKHSSFALGARPQVRVRGYAVLGNVEIRTAPRPGG